jgi:methylated-DNA-[protein]-cysteine S-methyltransferase
MLVIEFSKNNVVARRWNTRDIEEAVYILTQLIPLGCVTTYKDIAKVLKVSPRLVARILSKNKKPILIPCHRVINADGSIGGYTLNGKKAPEFKKRLLDLEKTNKHCKYSLSKLLGLASSP